MTRCASEVCGVRRVGKCVRKGSEWWNDEVNEVVVRKRRAYEEWLQMSTSDAYEVYKEKRREVKNLVKRAKRQADERWGVRVSEKFSESKKVFWKEIKRLRKNESSVEERVKDVNGSILVGANEVKMRWMEYFEDLLNVEDEREANVAAIGNDCRMPVLGQRND